MRLLQKFTSWLPRFPRFPDCFGMMMREYDGWLRHEDEGGFLKQNFFKTKKNKAKFISGPFTQMVFDIIEEKGLKLKILINNMNMTISKSTNNLLYSYI